MTTMLDDSKTFDDEKDPLIWFTADDKPCAIRRSMVARIVPQTNGTGTLILNAREYGPMVDQSPEEVRKLLSGV